MSRPRRANINTPRAPPRTHGCLAALVIGSARDMVDKPVELKAAGLIELALQMARFPPPRMSLTDAITTGGDATLLLEPVALSG